MQLWCAKVVEQTEVVFEVKTFGGSGNIVLDGSPDSAKARRRGSTFGAAFTKLLWPLVIFLLVIICFSHIFSHYSHLVFY